MCKINRKTWEQIQSQDDAIPFLFQDDFHALLAPFIVQNLKKKLLPPIQVVRMDNFWVKNGPFAQTSILLLDPEL